MKLVALDLETTGTNPQKDQILQLGAVVFDTETKETVGEFDKVIHHDRIEGDPYALVMNAWLIEKIQGGHAYPWGAVKSEFTEFLCTHALSHYGANITHRPVAVGFNVGSFDCAFLNANTNNNWFSHRTVELGSLLMAMCSSDVPVSSKDAAAMLGKEDLDHTALQDAKDARDIYFHWMAFREQVRDHRLDNK